MKFRSGVAHWSGRVLRCWAAWAGLIVVAVLFDIVARGTGYDQRSLGRLFLATLSSSLVMGAISGSILPRGLDPKRFELPMPQPDEHLVTPPNVLVHSIRRAAVAVPFIAATTCAVLYGLLSVTPDIVQGVTIEGAPVLGSPSTIGATGGVLYGIVLGFLSALPAGTLFGIAAALAIDGDLSYGRSALVSIGAAVAVGVIPLLLLFDMAPVEPPSPVVAATSVAFVAACAAAGWSLVRWRYRTGPG